MSEVAEYCREIRNCCTELSAFLRTTNELVRLAESLNVHFDSPRREPEPWRLSREQASWCERLGVNSQDAEKLSRRAYEQKAALREKLARRVR